MSRLLNSERRSGDEVAAHEGIDRLRGREVRVAVVERELELQVRGLRSRSDQS